MIQNGSGKQLAVDSRYQPPNKHHIWNQHIKWCWAMFKAPVSDCVSCSSVHRLDWWWRLGKWAGEDGMVSLLRFSVQREVEKFQTLNCRNESCVSWHICNYRCMTFVSGVLAGREDMLWLVTLTLIGIFVIFFYSWRFSTIVVFKGYIRQLSWWWRMPEWEGPKSCVWTPRHGPWTGFWNRNLTVFCINKFSSIVISLKPALRT